MKSPLSPASSFLLLALTLGAAACHTSATSQSSGTQDEAAATACDAAALETLTKTLDDERDAWSPSLGRALQPGPRIVEALRAACPAPHVESIINLLEPNPDAFGIAASHRPRNAVYAERLCPQVGTIASELPELAGPERPGALYDRCDLSATTSIAKTSFTAAQMAAGVVDILSLRFALADAGVNQAVATTLSEHAAIGAAPPLRIPPNLKLPAVPSGRPLSTATVDAAVTVDEIVTEGEVFSWEQPGPVFDMLADRAEPRKGSTPVFLIAVDRDLPWSKVSEFEAIAKKAGAAGLNVLVLTDDRFYPYRSVALPAEGDPTKSVAEVLAASAK